MARLCGTWGREQDLWREERIEEKSALARMELKRSGFAEVRDNGTR